MGLEMELAEISAHAPAYGGDLELVTLPPDFDRLPDATLEITPALRLPASALHNGLPRLEPHVYSRAIRTFPHTHGAVLRQSDRARRSMNLGTRPPLQLPIVRSQPTEKMKMPLQLAKLGASPNVVPGVPRIQVPFGRPTADQLVVRWQPPPDDATDGPPAQIDAYCVELVDQTGGGGVRAFKAVATRAGSARGTTLRRLVEGHTYAIRIRCSSAAGWGRCSAVEIAKIPIGGVAITMEPVGAGLTDVAIELDWHYPPSAGLSFDGTPLYL